MSTDYKHGIAVRRIVDRRGRQGNYFARLAERHLDLNEHSGTQAVVFVGEVAWT